MDNIELIKKAFLFLYSNTDRTWNAPENPLGFKHIHKEFGVSVAFNLQVTNKLTANQVLAIKKILRQYKQVLCQHGFNALFE